MPETFPSPDQPSAPDHSALDRAERGFFLALYRSAVDYYQPRIEKRTSVRLGEIAVWDHNRLHEHVWAQYRRRLGVIKSLIFRRRVDEQASAFKERYVKLAGECGARY